MASIVGKTRKEGPSSGKGGGKKSFKGCVLEKTNYHPSAKTDARHDTGFCGLNSPARQKMGDGPRKDEKSRQKKTSSWRKNHPERKVSL